MLRLEITDRNTVLVQWKRTSRRHEIEGEVELGASGQVIKATNALRELMPADFNPETEARRMKQGGCCGQATE